MSHFVCILASRPGGAIYVGAALDLRQRIEKHRMGSAGSHTKKYHIHTLVYFEQHDTLEAALIREKQLKRWRRVWKDELIGKLNPK